MILPYALIIQNSWHSLLGLSHSVLIFQKAQFHISTVVVCSPSYYLWKGLLLQMHLTLVVCNRTLQSASLVPRPRPAFRRFQYGKAGRGPRIFSHVSDVRIRVVERV